MAHMLKSNSHSREQLTVPTIKTKKSSVDDIWIARRRVGRFRFSIDDKDNSIKNPSRINETLAQVSKPNVSEVKANIKSTLPKLDPIQIRRFRLPYYDAAILELEEEGFLETVRRVKALIEFDEKIRERVGLQSTASTKNRLKNEKKNLQPLIDGLKSAEIAKRSGNLRIQAAALTETAFFFESKSVERNWIAEQLYRNCLTIAGQIRDDEGQIFNIVKYIYGRFILDKINDPEEALQHLNQVRTASKGKKWYVPKKLGFEEGTLYTECCVLLHRALLLLSERVKEKNPELAVQAAMQALQRANDSGRNEAIGSALYELGKNQLAAGNVKNALGSLSKFLAISKRIPDPEGVCKAHMELAYAYEELNDSQGTVKHLCSLRECAKQYELPDKLAQAHYYTGEYLLNKSRANLATPHLERALIEFASLGKRHEADRARCAAAVSKGQEVMEDYIELVSNCRPGNYQAIIKICNWKNGKVPFWSRDERNTEDSVNEDSRVDRASAESILSLAFSAFTSKASSDFRNDAITWRDGDQSEKIEAIISTEERDSIGKVPLFISSN